VGGKCQENFNVGPGGSCKGQYECQTGLVCAANNTCITATTELVECDNGTDCSSGMCLCSLFSGESFCADPALNPCTDEVSDLDSCITSNNCTTISTASDACSYTNCYSELKKYYSCGCSVADDVYESCSYNPYCGGFPVWAIIVIIVVAVVLILAIVLLVFFMMRRRPHYDSI
jgi:hypothetical protein